MSRFYLFFGIILSLLLGFANTIGWDVMNFNNLHRIGPHAPNVYHK